MIMRQHAVSMQENPLRLIINNYIRFPLSFYDITIRLKHRGRCGKNNFITQRKFGSVSLVLFLMSHVLSHKSACSTLKASKSLNTCSSTRNDKHQISILVRNFCEMLLRGGLGLLWRTIAGVTLNCRFKMPSFCWKFWYQVCRVFVREHNAKVCNPWFNPVCYLVLGLNLGLLPKSHVFIPSIRESCVSSLMTLHWLEVRWVFCRDQCHKFLSVTTSEVWESDRYLSVGSE